MLGAGFDLMSHETRQPAVTGTFNNPMPEDIQQGEFKFLRIDSTEAFDHALNVGTRLTGQSTLVPSGRKLEFQRHFRFSLQATFCVLRVLGLNAYQTLQAPRLTRDVRNLLKSGNQRDFREQFGDGFLSGQLTGVEFFGVIRIEANTIERQRELAAQLQASCELDKAVVSTTFKEKLSNAEHRITMAAYQRGGLVSVCESPDDLVAMANDALDDWRHQRGYPFATEVDPYHALGSSEKPSAFLNIEPARQCLASLAQHTQHLETMLNDIDFVTRNLQWFEKANIPELQLARKIVCNELGKITEHARRTTADPGDPQDYFPNYPQLEIPPRKLAPTAIEVRGGSLLQTKQPEEHQRFFPAMKYIRAGNFKIP